MLEMLLGEMNNWFVAARYRGAYSVQDGALDFPALQVGQYYRIRGSVFNDGLHRYGDDVLISEAFQGEVAALAIPREVIQLAEEIAAYREKNPDTDKVSESFGGYSYTRGASNAGAPRGWRAVFSGRMARWKKPYEED